jgi:hypothetical protein
VCVSLLNLFSGIVLLVLFRSTKSMYGSGLQTKDKTELDGVEDYVYARILANDKSWVPRSRYLATPVGRKIRLGS